MHPRTYISFVFDVSTVLAYDNGQCKIGEKADLSRCQSFAHDHGTSAKLFRSSTYIGSDGEICFISASFLSMSGSNRFTVFGKKLSYHTRFHVYACANGDGAQAQA